MAYASWSVVFGEQPSASKWNILGTNDASFNDGTGIGTNAIAAASLATSAIKLGYTQVTSIGTITSSASAQQLTGLSSTVTIPAGNRSIEITGYLPYIYDGTGGRTILLTIWDGTVASGTQIGQQSKFVNSASEGTGMTVKAVVTPAAGSKTYNLGISDQSTGSLTFTGLSSTNPAFILVKAI